MDANVNRRATVAVAVQFAVNGAFMATFVPRLPELRDAIGISTEAIGIVLTVASGAGLFASMTCRRLIAAAGTRRVLFVGGLVMAGCLLGVGWSTSWPLTVVALACLLAVDVYVDVAMNMQASWLSARRRRSIMNRIHGLWSLGSVAGGLVAGWAAGRTISLSTHLTVVAGALAILSSIVAVFLLPTDEVHAGKLHSGEVRTSADDGHHPRPVRRMSRASAVFLFAGFAAIAIETTAITWSPFRITDDLGGAESTGALAFAAVMAGSTLGRFAGDHLSHMLGVERFTTAAAAVATAGLVAASFVTSEVVALGCFFVAGLGIATLVPHLYDEAARAGGGSASGLGVLTAGTRVASIVTPIAVGALAGAATVGVAIATAAILCGAMFVAATTTRLKPVSAVALGNQSQSR